MTKELEFPERRPEALFEHSQDRLVEAVKEWVDHAGGVDPQDLLRELNKAVIEQVLETELDHHLGYPKHDSSGDGSGNTRNGTRPKTVKTIVGDVKIDVPRDRNGSFEPIAVRPYQRRLSGFDDMVVSLYGKGLTTGEIRSHLSEIYDTSVSPELISEITDRVLAEFNSWQNRPLADIWPVVVIDAIRIRTLSDKVRPTPVYVAMGISLEGRREILGLWYATDLAAGESASWWASVLVELQNRGINDIVYLCCDGLTGLPEAVEAVFPDTTVQGCVVHLTRASMRSVPRKQWPTIAARLKAIYHATSAEEAALLLDDLETDWGQKYPAMIATWRRSWDVFTPFLGLPMPIRKLIYTSNMVESLNARFRSAARRRGHFPDTKSALKVLYLTAIEHRKGRSNPEAIIMGWHQILNQLAVLHPNRITID
jgi:transposase-like protein